MTDINTIAPILRSFIIEQTGVNAQFVRDATTEYGAYLDQHVSHGVFETITPSNTMILFELKTRESSSNMSYTNKDNSISYFNSYRLHIIIYGNDSGNVANKLVARFRTEKVRNAILASGIYMESISEPFRITEFKNSIVWQRNDIDVDISCEISITQISTDPDYTSFDKINIIQRS